MRASVSGTASKASCVSPAATTVRQTPSIATESPIAAPRAVSGASIASRTPSAPPSSETTVPTSRISPVNMLPLNLVRRACEPGSRVSSRRHLRETHEPGSKSEPGSTRISRRRRASRPSRGRAPRAGRARPGPPSRARRAARSTASRPPGASSSVPISSTLRRSSSLPSWRVSQWLRCATSWSSARWVSGVVDIRFEEHVVADGAGRQARQRAR